MFNHLVLRPPKRSFEYDKFEPIPNRLKFTDVDPSERAKLVKVGLDMITRGKRKAISFQRFYFKDFLSGCGRTEWWARNKARIQSCKRDVQSWDSFK